MFSERWMAIRPASLALGGPIKFKLGEEAVAGSRLINFNFDSRRSEAQEGKEGVALARADAVGHHVTECRPMASPRTSLQS